MVQLVDFKLPILFPDVLTHADVAKAYPMVSVLRRDPGNVISAGYYNLLTHEAMGDSPSLELSSRPEDGPLIEAFLSGGDGLLQMVLMDQMSKQEAVS